MFSIKKINEKVKLPEKSYEGDAGFDVFAIDEIIIPKGKTIKVPLGFSVEIPCNFMMLLYDKSGIANKGIHLIAGVVDSTYRGELCCVFINTNKNDFTFKCGQKIAQMILLPCYTGTMYTVVDELSDTERGNGGFGSTGVF